MPQPLFDAEGNEIEVYTKEEVDAISTEFTEKLTKAEQDALDAKDHLAKKTDEFVRAKQGFKRYEEYTEEEKAKMTEERKEYILRIERMEDDQKKERETAKEALFVKIANGDDAVLAKLKEKYALVQMPEGTVAEITERINSVTPWVFSELGIMEKKPAPISSVVVGGGEPPRQPGNEDKRFAETEKGKQVEQAMFGGVIPNK